MNCEMRCKILKKQNKIYEMLDLTIAGICLTSNKYNLV